MNASTMANDPIAVVSLPVRVPFGFHGIFVPEADLARYAFLPAITPSPQIVILSCLLCYFPRLTVQADSKVD